jgi:prepilin-type N-terminal cleavage/methylation domain-containing protein
MAKWFDGYTIIELIAVSAIMLIVAVMAVGSVSNIKRYSIEERAVHKLRQLADVEERYRNWGHIRLNEDSSYGTFDELVLAELIPNDFSEDDVKMHTVNAFVPYYRVDIALSPNDLNDEPDSNHYYVRLLPIPTKWNLRTFHMLEDGEIWHSYGLYYYER